MKTTLNQIKANHPCKDGYKKLLKFLGKTEADDEPLALSTILESNGLDDAIWCFRTISGGYEKELRLFAVFCARQVQHLMTDPRSIAAIDVAERYANGNATDEELKAAHTAAFNAARAAAFNAASAASAAAYAASNTAYSASNTAYSAFNAISNAAYAAYSDADSEMQSVLEAYLKNMLSETEK